MWSNRAIGIGLLLLASCDRPKPVVAPVTPTTVPAAVTSAQVRTVTPLKPKTQTHLAIDSAGTTYWVQESTDGRDTVFALGLGEVPIATAVSSLSILRALNVTEPGAGGNIQSLAAGFDDTVYFYFAGGTRRAPVHAIGRFKGVGGAVEILVGPESLSRDSGFGLSIDLARATLFTSPSEKVVWLWLRHTDRSGLFQIQQQPPGQAGTTPTDSSTTSTDRAKLIRPFPFVLTDDDEELPLVRPDYHLSASPDGSLVMLDTNLGGVWRIDATNGRARIVKSLVTLPNVISAPMFDSAGNLILLFGNGPLLEAKVEAMVAERDLNATYPGLKIFKNPTDKRIKSPWTRWTGDVTTISGDDLRFSPDLDPATFSPREVDAEFGLKSWIVYDHASGKLVRVSVEAGE